MRCVQDDTEARRSLVVESCGGTRMGNVSKARGVECESRAIPTDRNKSDRHILPDSVKECMLDAASFDELTIDCTRRRAAEAEAHSRG